MEKIIVYKKDGFKECSNHYSWLCVKLQELSRLVVEAGSTPTMERLQMLLKLRERIRVKIRFLLSFQAPAQQIWRQGQRQFRR